MKRILSAALALAGLCPAQVSYKVRLPDQGGRIVQLPAEKYVAAVLAGESGTFRSEEALKAMAVAARTYAARLRGRHAADGYDFCDTTHCQHLDLDGIAMPRFARAAEATAGELLWFKGELAFAAYTRDCGGQTESVQYVWPHFQAPYLLSHADPFCTRHAAAWSWSAPPQDIAAALHSSNLDAPDDLARIIITQITPSHRAQRLGLIGHNTQVPISASSFRFAIGRNLGWNTLRSQRYEIENRDSQIYFRGIGEGHGIGLCQHGADEMGLEGRAYREILAFFYPGTVVAQTAAGFDWVQMAGERLTVLSTNPDRDRQVLSQSEALNRSLAARFGWGTPQITIRVYPDIAAFRNATGEPGWVAARASGSSIDLQPTALLQARGILTQTLRHELLHVAIERRATAGLPVWFREGLVEYLDAGKSSRPDPAPARDADFEQRHDQLRAQAAYAEARARVAALITRYGEPTVLGWVARGLPAEVKNSSTSSAPANSR